MLGVGVVCNDKGRGRWVVIGVGVVCIDKGRGR